MKIIVFSGAGISKESGLNTFRKGGLWDGQRVEDVANASGWYGGNDESRQRMLDFYNNRRREVRHALPNAAHKALAEFESAGHEVIIITQNIDDLVRRSTLTHIAA
jgi:NAD-dependent deacetylase